LRGTVVTITVDGSVVGSYGYNAAVADGKLGAVSRDGNLSVDRARVQTNDNAFTGVQLPPELRIGDAVVTEGTTGTTTVSIGLSLSKAAASAMTVGWRTVDGTAAAGTDFIGVSAGTVTFAAGNTTATIQVTVVGDALYEANETLSIELTSWAGFNLADKSGLVTITNDDAAPVITVTATDASGSEPGTDKIVFTITRTANLTGAVTVNLTWAGTASASDYTLSLGAGRATVTLADGVSSATVTVTPIDDTAVEPAESVTLTIAAGAGYAVGSPSSASATILDNDKPALSIASASITEGNTGTKPVAVTVTLSAATSSTVTVAYTTVAATATAGSDYQAASGTLTFAPGVTSQTINVTIMGDRAKEPNETFTVVLSNPTNATIATGTATVTILNDESALTAASTPPASATAPAELTAGELAATAAQAEALWVAADADADFTGVTFSIARLDGSLLGITGGLEITIDATAAGWGWSLSSSGGVEGRMDLLTVVLHELGHTLGLDHDADGLMAETLAPGVSEVVGWHSQDAPAAVVGIAVPAPAMQPVAGVVKAPAAAIVSAPQPTLVQPGGISSKTAAAVPARPPRLTRPHSRRHHR